MKKIMVLVITFLFCFFAFSAVKNETAKAKILNKFLKDESAMLEIDDDIPLVGFKVINKSDLEKAGVSEENIENIGDTIKNFKLIIEKNAVVIQQKQLEIKKLMLEEKKNWGEIEKLFYDIGKLRAENGIKGLRLKEDIGKYITEEEYEKALQSAKERVKKRVMRK